MGLGIASIFVVGGSIVPTFVNDKDSKVDVNKVKIESNRPAVANRNSDVPKTSDSSNIALYSMLLIGSIGVISVIFKRKLRTNK